MVKNGNTDTAIPSKRVYIMNGVIERFSTSFKKNLIEISPDINAEIIPVAIAHGDIEIGVFESAISTPSYNAEPMIIGIESRKEKVVASSFFTP